MKTRSQSLHESHLTQLVDNLTFEEPSTIPYVNYSEYQTPDEVGNENTFYQGNTTHYALESGYLLLKRLESISTTDPSTSVFFLFRYGPFRQLGTNLFGNFVLFQFRGLTRSN